MIAGAAKQPSRRLTVKGENVKGLDKQIQIGVAVKNFNRHIFLAFHDLFVQKT
jgi:hypothetical protein